MSEIFVGDIRIPNGTEYVSANGTKIIFRQEVMLRVRRKLYNESIFECDLRDANPRIDVIFPSSKEDNEE